MKGRNNKIKWDHCCQ